MRNSSPRDRRFRVPCLSLKICRVLTQGPDTWWTHSYYLLESLRALVDCCDVSLLFHTPLLKFGIISIHQLLKKGYSEQKRQKNLYAVFQRPRTVPNSKLQQTLAEILAATSYCGCPPTCRQKQSWRQPLIIPGGSSTWFSITSANWKHPMAQKHHSQQMVPRSTAQD